MEVHSKNPTSTKHELNEYQARNFGSMITKTFENEIHSHHTFFFEAKRYLTQLFFCKIVKKRKRRDKF